MSTFYKIILFLFLFCVVSEVNLFSQNQNYDFDKIDSLIEYSYSENVLPELGKYLEIANKENDTLNLIRIYDSYAKYFEKDTANDNEKKFLLQKIVYLKKYYHSHKSDTVYLYDLYDSYERFAYFLEQQNEVFMAIDLYFRMLYIAQSIESKILEASVYRLIGSAYQYQNKFSHASSYYNQSLEISREIGDSNLVFKNIFLIGVTNYTIGEYSDAISYFYQALYIAEDLDDNILKSLSYNQIARIYFDLGFYEKASELIQKSLEIISTQTETTDLNSNGITYLFCGKNYFQMGDYQKSIEFYEKALQIFSYVGNQNSLADVFSDLGQVYTEIEKYDLAEKYLTKAFLIRKKNGTKLDLVDSYIAFGKYYGKLENIVLAKYNLINAYKIAVEINNYQFIKESSSLLYKIFKEEQNFEIALTYLEDFKNSSDSITKQNNLLYLKKVEVEQEYKLHDKMMQDELTFSNNSKSKLRLLLVLLSVLLVGLIVFSIFFIRKSKIASRQNRLIEKQKQIILKQYARFKQLSLVASHTKNSIFIMSTTGEVSWVNDALLETYQTTLNEIFEIKKGNFRLLTKYPNPDEIFITCVNKRQVFKYISEVEVAEKKYWIHTEISPIVENGEVTNLIAIETDISSVKQAEKEIKKQKKDIEYKNELMEIYNQELKQQKEAIVTQNEELVQQQEELQTQTDLLKKTNLELERLSVVASETDNVIYIFNIKGDLLWINNAFTKYTGYTFDDFIQIHGANILKASTFPDINYYFFVCSEQKKSVKYVSQFTTKSGRILWVQTTLTPIQDKEGNVMEIVAIDSDITDIKNAEQRISYQNQEIKSSLEYAGRIQKSVLPLPIYIEAIFEKYFIFNRPRDIVSGDFYFVHYEDEKAIISLADSTGHGIPGAFMSLLGTMVFKIVMSRIKSFDPNIILKMLNSEMIRLLHQRGRKNEAADSIDLALCIYDFKKNNVEYAGANIPLYVARKNEDEEVSVQRIRPTKGTIGYDKLTESFTVHSFNLTPGDRFYLSSDGFVDQFGGENNKKLKRKNFVSMLKDLYSVPFDEQEMVIDNFLKNWIGANEQIDDILVIGIEA